MSSLSILERVSSEGGSVTWVESYGVVFSQAQEEDCACLAMLARSSHSSEDSTLRLYPQDSSRCCDDILTSTVSFRAGAKRVEQVRVVN